MIFHRQKLMKKNVIWPTFFDQISVGVICSYRYHQIELNRKEAYFRHKLTPQKYDWIQTRQNIFENYKYSKEFADGSICPTLGGSPDQPRIREAGKKYLQQHIFHPKSPDRKQFDIETLGERKYSWTGPITIPKRTAPRLLPIPFFFIGAYTMRNVTTGHITDIAGMEWLREWLYIQLYIKQITCATHF